MVLTDEQREAQKIRQREYRKRKRRLLGKRNYLKEQRETKQAYREALRAEHEPNIFQSDAISSQYTDQLKGLSDAISDALKKINAGQMTPRQASKVIPKLKDSIQAAPGELVKLGEQKNCAELVEEIVELNEKKIEEDPRKKDTLPKRPRVEGAMALVNTLWREYFGKNRNADKKTGRKADPKAQNCLDYEWTRDTGKVTKFILKRWKIDRNGGGAWGTRNAQFSALSSHLRNLEGFEKEHSYYSQYSTDVYNKHIKPKLKQNKLTKTQETDYVTYDVLLKNRKKLKPGSFEGAVVSMYMDTPPRRVKDYYLMKVFKKTKGKSMTELDKEFNYLVIDTRGNVTEMVFNAYKTAKTFGQQVITPDRKEMNKYLKPYMKEFDIKPGGFLFPNAKGKSLRGALGALVQKSFSIIAPGKKQPLAGLVRHSYVTYIRKKFGNSKPDSYFEDIAENKMAHSYSTSLDYRVLEEALE